MIDTVYVIIFYSETSAFMSYNGLGDVTKFAAEQGSEIIILKFDVIVYASKFAVSV